MFELIFTFTRVFYDKIYLVFMIKKKKKLKVIKVNSLPKIVVLLIAKEQLKEMMNLIQKGFNSIKISRSN